MGTEKLIDKMTLELDGEELTVEVYESSARLKVVDVIYEVEVS